MSAVWKTRDDLAADLQRAEATQGHLRARLQQFREYAKHQEGCRLADWPAGREPYGYYLPKCTCGLADLLTEKDV